MTAENLVSGLSCERIGDRDPLVLIHGTGSSRSVWRPVTPLLAAHHELTGCGHVPTWDDPRLVARVILETTGQSAREVGGSPWPG